MLLEPDVVFPFDRDPSAPSIGRRVIRSLFEADDPLAERVTLSVSELISNVVLHTDGGGEMRVWDPKPNVPLRVEIEDFSVSAPVARPSTGLFETGRGLVILESLAEAWGTLPTSTGKVVWAEFDRNLAQAQASSTEQNGLRS